MLRRLAPFAAALWQHRGLLWQFTVRNIEIRHRGSMLGFMWAVLNPLLMLTLYVFVFGFIFGGTFGAIPGETRWDYGLGVFLGLTFFHLLAESIAIAPTLIVSNPNFVKRVVFPLEILPAAAVGAAMFHMVISLTMVIVGTFLGGRVPSLAGLGQMAVLLPPVTLLALGLVWLFAALGVFFRDLAQIVGVLLTGWMFASAIFYPISRIPAEAWAILKFNPLIHIVDTARNALLWQIPVPFFHWLLLYACSGLVVTLGYACFARLKPAFADVI